ncbi:hypothetical protein [Haloechinothrix sp. LS1_15]|uniref:hypothetical protein n=1 Tax=Haloechinothrix sp. LS1_15 TaxID=2652248 RepID=UPI002947BF96|nr:hypothetical protein [Haloechinothrix sp. LS1_15]MDV6012398.1 hypothetical protein [Haloechinothrix sp. LS1_15]
MTDSSWQHSKDSQDDTESTVQAADPRAGFAVVGSAQLDETARRVTAMREAVAEGDLELDEDTAERVLAMLDGVRCHVARVVSEAPGLDAPLQLGNNWVAGVMSRRLHGAASGEDTSAIPVLAAFDELITDFERIVREAVTGYRLTDEDAAAELDAIGSGVDDQGGVR